MSRKNQANPMKAKATAFPMSRIADSILNLEASGLSDEIQERTIATPSNGWQGKRLKKASWKLTHITISVKEICHSERANRCGASGLIKFHILD